MAKPMGLTRTGAGKSGPVDHEFCAHALVHRRNNKKNGTCWKCFMRVDFRLTMIILIDGQVAREAVNKPANQWQYPAISACSGAFSPVLPGKVHPEHW
jgi:hypothetical protein